MPQESIANLPTIEYNDAQAAYVHRPVIAETRWVLYVDRREIVTFMCSPRGLHELAVGFLLSEGMISHLDDIWQLKVYLDESHTYYYFPDAGLQGELRLQVCDSAIGAIDVRLRRPTTMRRERRILATGCGGGITFDDQTNDQPALVSDISITSASVFALMHQLNEAATLYRTSRGVHTSALSDPAQLLVIAEDVGRHNTLDKIRGMCMLGNIPTRDRILISSGRISSEMITKARKMDIPIVISRTSPTTMSIELAQRWNMTVIGYVRSRRMRVYTGAARVIFTGDSALQHTNDEEG